MPFNSFLFKSFCLEWGIKLITSSPLYPKSNGLVERSVGIVKNMMKKSNDLWLSLLEYRNTPLKEIDLSPAELLLNRRTRSILPERLTNFYGVIHPRMKQNFERRNQRSRFYYNRNAKKKDWKYQKHEPIWYYNGKFWEKAVIESVHDTPRSYWI